MVWQRLRQKINVKYFMIGYLTLLLLYSSMYLKEYKLFVQGFFIVTLYSLYDLVWTYLREKIWYLPLSSCISGLVLSLIVFPNLNLTLIVLFPLIAVLSKHLILFGKNRHIFNPASFALATIAITTPIAWWAPAIAEAPQTTMNILYLNPGNIFFDIIIFGGIFILWRQKRWHITLSFLASYIFCLTLLLNFNGTALSYIPRLLTTQIMNGVTIFFATVMLIEPMTSTFNNWHQEVSFGVIVGFAVVVMTYLTGRFNWSNQDPLIYGLLIGNLVASLLFLPPKLIKNSADPINS